ncbi:MAG: PAS domain S-box protein [Kiritimatiellales bacterium]
MDAPQGKIVQLESTISALEELLTVSETSFLEESKKLEAANERLRKENAYRTFFEASAEAMLTLCDGVFIDCNESAVRMLKAKDKTAILKARPGELSPEYQPDGRLSSEKAHEMISLAEKNGFHCFEWYHKRTTGEVFPVEVSLTAITIDGKKMFNSAWQDITDKKNAERELKEYHEHLEELVKTKTKEISIELEKHEALENDIRQILDASGDAIRVIDCDFNIIYANRPLKQLKDRTQELRGKKCYEVVPEKECFTPDCSLQKVLRTGKKYTKEEAVHSKEGQETPYLVTIAPYIDSSGKVIGVIKSYRDISEEKTAQKTAEEAALQHGRVEMVNNMLHDIGNALTGISAYVLKPQVEKRWPEIKSLHQLHELFVTNEQELIRVFGKEKQQALSGFITALTTSFEERNARHIESFEKIAAAVGHVCSVLDLQRHYMREKSSPLATEINLTTIINDTLVMLASSIQKRNIKINLTSADKNLTVAGDQTRLIRVFLNIIKNIYEAFDDEEAKDDRRLDINIMLDETKNDIRVVFLDNAIGFDPETGEKLFTRGFTTKSSGSGIGLHECRSIIESHNGTMSIESKGKHAGAMTTITLPILNKKRNKPL